MRKDVLGGIIGLAIGIWFCFIFAVVFYLSLDGVSELFENMFHYSMLYVPGLISSSMVVIGILGIIFWSVLGVLVGLLIMFLTRAKAKKHSKPRVVSAEEFKKYGEILDKKIVKAEKKIAKEGLDIRKHLEEQKVVLKKKVLKKKRIAGIGAADLKKYGEILDAKIVKARARMKKESLEIKKDLEALGKMANK